jgi:hypothetical protein
MYHLFKIQQYKFILPALLLPVYLPAQQRQAVQGKVFAGNAGVPEVLIVNFTGQAETRADSLGNFSLKMQVGDLLIVNDRRIETKKIRYTQDLLKNNLLLLEATLIAKELEEVVINRSTVTSQSLGIPMGKKYTPAERRLRTAAGLDPTLGVGMMPGVSVSLDAIINAISGRTKMLKKELVVEKKELAMQKMETLFTEKYYVETLKLAPEQIPGFKYYAVEDTDFRQLLTEGNGYKIELKAAELSKNYLDLQNDEK